MPTKSKVEMLPEEQRQKIDKLLQDPKVTLDALAELVQEMGADVSRSALGRRKQALSVVGERIRRSREMAESLVTRFGEQPDAMVARLNIQFLHSAIMDTLGAADEEGAPLQLTPQQAKALAQAVESLARAEKTDSDRMFKVRKEATEEAAKKTIAAVDGELKKNKQPGLSAEAIDNIWNAVGIKREAAG